MRKGCFHTISAHGPPPKPSSPRSLFHWHLNSDLFPKPFEGHKFILDVQSPVCVCQVSRQKLSWTLFTQSTSLHLHTEPDSGSCCFQAAFYLLIAKNTNPKLPIGTLVIFAMNCPVKPGFLWGCIDRISTRRWVFSVQESLTVLPLQRQCAHPEAHFKSRVTRPDFSAVPLLQSVTTPEFSSVLHPPSANGLGTTPFRPWQVESSCTQRNCSAILKEILRIKKWIKINTHQLDKKAKP